MQEGSFYAATCKSPVGGWFARAFSRSSDKHLDARLEGLVRRCSSDNSSSGLECEVESLSEDSAAEPPDGIRNSHVASCRVTGGGVVVKHGIYEIAGDLFRVAPYIHSDEHGFVVFYGYLSNLDQLSFELGTPKRNRLQSFEQHGTKAAALLYQLYLKSRDNDGELLVLLSELQGQYAFVVFDSSRKLAFAARDSSGREELFYNVEEDGTVSFTNAPIDVPEAGQLKQEWIEIPPGYFVSGRNPRLQQFALTADELHARELLDSVDDDIVFSSESYSATSPLPKCRQLSVTGI